MRSWPWVTVAIKRGGQTTVDSYVEPIDDEVFVDEVLLSFLDTEIT